MLVGVLSPAILTGCADLVEVRKEHCKGEKTLKQGCKHAHPHIHPLTHPHAHTHTHTHAHTHPNNNTKAGLQHKHAKKIIDILKNKSVLSYSAQKSVKCNVFPTLLKYFI